MKKVIHLTLLVAVMIVLAIVISKSMKEATVGKNINGSVDGLEPSEILPEQLNLLEGVSFVQVAYDKDANVIKFILQNNTNDTIYYGEKIILEKKYNDGWYRIPYSGEVGFTSILNNLSPSDESEGGVPMNVWVPVTAGEYRIIYEVSTQQYLKNLYPISADFTIDK